MREGVKYEKKQRRKADTDSNGVVAAVVLAVCGGADDGDVTAKNDVGKDDVVTDDADKVSVVVD